MLKTSIELIKERVSVSSIVSKVITLKKRGKDFWGICPFHKESTPSFSINDEKKFYHCFGCGAHGDIFSFLIELRHFTFLEALKDLAKLANVTLEEQTSEVYREYELIQQALVATCSWFIENLHVQYKETILKIALKRISLEYIKKFKIGYAPVRGLKKHLQNLNFEESIINKAGLLDANHNDYFKDRIIFPIFNTNNKILGFGGRIIDSKIALPTSLRSPKYLNSKETLFFKKNEILYGIDIAKNFCKNFILVVEGYIDVITLHEKGIKNAIGLLGTAFNVNHFNKISFMTKTIIFCFDGDEAGKKATIRTIKILLNIIETDVKIKFILLEKGDPEDYIKTHGIELFNQLIEESSLISETIWKIVYKENTAFKPEDYFSLEQQVKEYTNLISDKNLKNYYIKFFRDKIYNLQYNLQFKEKKIYTTSSVITKYEFKHHPTTKELMLKLILEYPNMLDKNHIYESFAMVDIEDIKLKKTHQHIIEYYNNNTLVTKNDLREYLSNIGIDLKNFDSIDIINYGIFDENIAKITWNKFILSLEIENLKEEYNFLIKNTLLDINIENKINEIAERIKKLQYSLEIISSNDR